MFNIMGCFLLYILDFRGNDGRAGLAHVAWIELRAPRILAPVEENERTDGDDDDTDKRSSVG
jgi:hypothetical protein